MPRKYPGVTCATWRPTPGFNEAGADAPEIPIIFPLHVPQPERFNEAGADAPEIPNVFTPSRLSPQSFNEAGADAPEIQVPCWC